MDLVVFVLEDILEAFSRWKFRDPLPEDAHKKVSKFKQEFNHFIQRSVVNHGRYRFLQIPLRYNVVATI